MANTKTTTTKKTNELSEGAKTALALLKEHKEGLTIAKMKELGFENANSSHLVALKKRGLIVSDETEIEVQTVVKRKVQLYKFVEKQ